MEQQGHHLGVVLGANTTLDPTAVIITRSPCFILALHVLVEGSGVDHVVLSPISKSARHLIDLLSDLVQPQPILLHYRLTI